MVRTAAVRVSAGKSSKKGGGGAKAQSSSGTSSRSGAGSSKSSSSLPPITYQETPTWQKPITNFFKLDGTTKAPLNKSADDNVDNVKNGRNGETRDDTIEEKCDGTSKKTKKRFINLDNDSSSESEQELEKEKNEKNSKIDKDESSGVGKKKKKRFMNLNNDSSEESDNEELEKMRKEIQENTEENKENVVGCTEENHSTNEEKEMEAQPGCSKD